MSALREFLVRIEIDTGDLDAPEVDRLRAAEAERADELIRSGNLRALWRIPGAWANYGVWSAFDEVSLTALLTSLPLRPYMHIDIQPLEAHPSDPRTQDADRGRMRPALEPLPELTVRLRAGAAETSVVRTRLGFDLAPLDDLSVRRRSSRSVPGQSGPGADRSAPVDAGHAMTWSSARTELDVTDLLEAIDPRERDTHVRELVATAVEAAERSAGSIDLTHSGALGLESAESWVSDDRVRMDVGAVRRVSMVRALPGGEEVLQIRSVVSVTVTLKETALEGVGSASRALSQVRDRLLATSRTP